MQEVYTAISCLKSSSLMFSGSEVKEVSRKTCWIKRRFLSPLFQLQDYTELG
jgi:hypothetical protein